MRVFMHIYILTLYNSFIIKLYIYEHIYGYTFSNFV